MVFKATTPHTKQPLVPKEDNAKEPHPIGFLNPKKDVEKAHPNDPYGVEMTQKSAHHQTLKTLNALTIVSPLISGLMEKPGVDAPNEEMSESFRHLIKEISEVAEKFCEKMGVDPSKEKNFWIRNVIEKHFADILRLQWTTTGNTNLNQLTSLFDQILTVAETASETNHYEELSPINTVKMAVFRVMMPIISEAKTNFDLYRDLEKDMEPITEKLLEVSSKAVDKLADEYADETSRAKLFYMIMQESGKLYAASWRSESKKIMEIMSQHTPEKLANTIEKYKSTGGFPLNRIEHDFEKYFNKMIIITDKLVKFQKGSIESRLKNK